MIVEKRSQLGVYAVFLAIFLAAALMLLAMVTAIGFMSVNRATYGNTINSASLAALERYMRAQEKDIPEREAAAIESANSEILSLNPLKSFGAFAGLGQLSAEGKDGKGGEVIFGEWKPSAASPTDKCNPGIRDEFPCFVRSSSSVNAVKIVGKTPEPLKIPFATILGANDVGLETEAIAAVVPRCVAFVLDSSLTATQQSHNAAPGGISLFPAGPPANPETDYSLCGSGGGLHKELLTGESPIQLLRLPAGRGSFCFRQETCVSRRRDEQAF